MDKPHIVAYIQLPITEAKLDNILDWLRKLVHAIQQNFTDEKAKKV